MTRLPTRSDRCRGTVEATIPRGRSKEDLDRTPAQDPAVWEDHVRLASGRDPAALDRLVAEYQGYARSLASRLHRGREPREDLDQIALEALVVALKRFDPHRSIPFPAFATPTILGAIRRHYRDHGWLVRVPRRVHEFAGAQQASTERLAASLRRLPTDEEVAADLSIEPRELNEARAAVHARDTRSLDAVVGEDGVLADLVGGDDAELGLAEDRIAAAEAIRSLDRSGRRLLRMYFFEERSQAQIATVLGVSQMQVSRLLRETLRQVRQRALAEVA